MNAHPSVKSQPGPPPEYDECDEFGELDLIERGVIVGMWVLVTAAVALFLLLASRHLPVF